MKKMLTLLTASSMFLIVAGCGGEEETTGEINEEDLSGEIEVWSWNVAASSLEMAAEKFMEEHPNVEITVQDSSTDDVYERMTVGLASGGSGLPDVVSLESSQLENYKSEFPEGFMNLSEWGFDEHEDKFTDFKISTAQDDEGNFVSMPWDIGPAGVFYRVDYFEEAGVDPNSIGTWEDYINAGEEIMEATGKQMLPIEVTNDDAPFRVMLNQQNVNYFNTDGEVSLASAEANQAMEVIGELADKDLIYNANDWDSLVGATVNGDVASIPTGAWYSGTLMDQAPDSSGDWGLFELPAFEADGNRAANSGGSDLAVIENTENPELAYAFAEYFTTNEEVQLESFKQYGLFPSLTSTYEDEYFSESVEYFNNSPIFETLANTTENINSPEFNNDIPRAEDVIIDAQSSVILSNEDVNATLDESADRLSSETGREIE